MNIVTDFDKIKKIILDATPEKKGWRRSFAPSKNALDSSEPEVARWILFYAREEGSGYWYQSALPLEAIADVTDEQLTSIVEAVWHQMESEIQKKIEEKFKTLN